MRRLLGMAVILCAGLACCAAGSPKPGVRGGLSPFVVAGSGSHGNAGWDTVVVVLSTQDIAAAAGDTFALPSSPSGTTSPPTLDYARVYEINDYILGRGAKSWRDDDGDKAVVYRIGEAAGAGADFPSFAYVEIDTLRPIGLKSTSLTVGAHSLPRLTLGGVAHLNMNVSSWVAADSATVGRTRLHLMYAPFEDILPAGCTIVSADIIASAASNTYQSFTDTTIATLMTNPNDNQWYKQKAVTNYPDWAEASWQRQWTAINGGGSQDGHPWNPELKLRTRPWHWGKISDWSSTAVATNSYIYTSDKMVASITNCVQAVVNGEVNNGIVISYHDVSASSTRRAHWVWDRLGSANVNWRTPVIVIKYITKRYQPPFGTSDLAFVFTTDDFRSAANSAFADTFNARGGVYTMFGSRTQANTVGMDSLLAWLDEGHEIGPHSKLHQDPLGLTHWERSRPGLVWDATARAEVYADAQPDWLYAMADSAIGDSLKSHPQFGKSMALPNNTISMGVQRVLADIGYLSVRGKALETIFDRTKWLSPPTWAPAYGDTGMSVAHHAQRRPRNMMLLPMSLAAGAIVGANDKDADLDSVRVNMRRALFQWRGTGRGEFVMLTHDAKSAPLTTGFYTDGIDPDELGAMLDVVNEYGARYMTASDLGRWRRATGTAIDTPTGFYNASVGDDSARYYAHERVWYKPDGIDTRWIRGVRDRAFALSVDGTAPNAPTGLLAVGGDGEVDLSWSHGGGEPVSNYHIYRHFDNGDTTMLVSGYNTTTYTDATAVNGSPHNYYVTARDLAGNESLPSAAAQATPGTILSIPRPAYYALWYQDPSNAALSEAKKDSLAAFDMVTFGPFGLIGTGEAAYDDLLADLRAKNDDIITLSYIHPWSPRNDWSVYAEGSPQRRIFDWLDANDGWAMTVSGDTAVGDRYPVKFVNVATPGAADTIAKFWVDGLEGSGVDGEYAGFFIDDVAATLPYFYGYSGALDDSLDFNEDGTGYSGDSQDKASWTSYFVRFMRALRREFAARGMHNRLLVANTDFGRATDPNATADTLMALLDGSMVEGTNRWFPGGAASDTTWDRAFAIQGMHTRAQVSPTMALYHAIVDSSATYQGEPVALAADGWVGVNEKNGGGGFTGANRIPTMPRRLPTPGTHTGYAIQAGAGDDPDTLTATYSNMTARLMLDRNLAATATDTFAVWPYLITKADGTILSRSAFWELPEDLGAPPGIAQFVVIGGLDKKVIVSWSALEYPGDFSHINIYRSTYAALDSLVLLASDPDETVYFGSPAYSDTAVVNDTEYCYGVTMVDVNGNEGPLDYFDCATPMDITPPSAPANLVAFGSPGQVAIGWSGVGAADLLRYRIYRSTLGSAFAQIDSTAAGTAWYLDTATTAGQDYTYVVRALDDDGNLSAASNQATGSWATPEPDYPSGLIVYSNNPASGQALLNWTAPDPADGLTRYRIYRDSSLLAVITDITNEAAYDEGTTSATYTDLNATADSTFYYAVTALFDATESDPSNIVAHTNPAPPSNERITDGLLALWEFDGLSGTTVPDVSGETPAMDLTLTSAANTTWTAYALRFDSGARLQTSGAATRINEAVAASNQITVEMWVRPTTASQSGAARLLSIALDGGTRNIVIGHGLESGGASTSVLARVRGETSFNSASGSLGTDLVHVVFVRGSDSTGRLYINGLQSTTGAMATDFAGWVSTYPLAIGNEVAGTERPWLGEVHLAAVYEHALTAQEISHNYGVGVPAMYGAPGPSRPELTATGGNEFIRLRWAAVPTAVKYRIYRRTQDTASTLLDSTTTAVTYDDATAVEGVTYFYLATAVNGTGVASPFSTEAAASWTTTTELSVDSVTGTVTHDGQIVIAGSGFGNKAPAAPVVYDNFEAGGSHGAVIDATATVGTWTQVGLDGVQLPYFNTSIKYAGSAAMEARFSGGQATSGVKIAGNYDDHFYIDAWVNYDKEDAAPWSRVRKLFLMFGDGEIEYPQIHFGTSDCTENPTFRPGGYASLTDQTSFEYAFPVNDIAGEWHHLQVWAQASDSGVANGKLRVWLDGVLRATSDAYLTVTNNTGNWDHMRVGYYHAHDEIAGLCDASPGDAFVYWDNVYVDNTPARIEIGNAATYAACTHREIQIPSDWSATSITATVNAGTLTGSNYLFVIRADGTPSVGFPVTIE